MMIHVLIRGYAMVEYVDPTKVVVISVNALKVSKEKIAK